METKIINYFQDNGLDLRRYVDDYSHVVPGTVAIRSISMWGYGASVRSGKYEDWIKLMELLKKPDCPVRMESIESHDYEKPNAFDRLIWKNEGT